MFKRFKQKLDDWAINAGYSTLPCPNPAPGQKEELAAILQKEGFFEAVEKVPELKFINSWQFEFQSAVEVCCPENNRVHGWFVRAKGDWKSRPLVVLVHGWNAELHYQYILPKVAKRLSRAGINTIAFELPLHSLRRPQKPFPIRNFISDHLPTVLQATRQSISDMHALVLWAKAQGCPKVAVWGFSLGAWLAGLYVTVNHRCDAAVLTTPVTDMSAAIEHLAFCAPIRAALKMAPMDTRFLDLNTRRPQLDANKVLLQEADYDNFIAHASYEQFARDWGLTQWLHAKQSHISILVSGRAMQEGVDWLAPVLRAGSSKV